LSLISAFSVGVDSPRVLMSSTTRRDAEVGELLRRDGRSCARGRWSARPADRRRSSLRFVRRGEAAAHAQTTKVAGFASPTVLCVALVGRNLAFGGRAVMSSFNRQRRRRSGGRRPACVHALSHPSPSSSSTHSSVRHIKAENAAVEINHTTMKISHHFTKVSNPLRIALVPEVARGA
jgi:hypothetical protein